MSHPLRTSVPDFAGPRRSGSSLDTVSELGAGACHAAPPWFATSVVSLLTSSAYGTAQDLGSYHGGFALLADSDVGDPRSGSSTVR
jgi:hypothetical protein